MTHRERLLAALRRQPVDRLPLAPFFNPLTPPQRLGHGWHFPFGPSEEDMAEYCAEVLGIGPAVALPIGDYHANLFMFYGDFFSPAMLKEFLGPLLREEIAAVHSAGKLIGYTVNTGVMPMLDWLAGLDFDCLLHLEMAAPGVDLARIREKLGDRKSFWMGPSAPRHLAQADPGLVRKALRTLCEGLGQRGLALTPSPSLHSTMPWANFLALVEEWKSFYS
jgi:hypothetical protein